MSRTDKDRPYWVRLNDPSENRRADHTHHPYGRYSKRWFGEENVCDIDTPMTGHFEIDRKRNCDYRLTNFRWYDDPTREDRHNEYYAPLRSEERMSLRKAARQYNTYGDVDDVYLQEQHRHSCYGGGYWN